MPGLSCLEIEQGASSPTPQRPSFREGRMNRSAEVSGSVGLEVLNGRLFR